MRITAFSTDSFLVAYPKRGLNGHLGEFMYMNGVLQHRAKKKTLQYYFLVVYGFFFFPMHILFPLILASNKSAFKKHIAVKERKV